MERERKGKTALKTFRLPEDLVQTMEQEAAREGVSLNSVAVTSLTRHLDYLSLARTREMVSVSKSLLMALVDATPDDKLVQTSRQKLPRVWKDSCIVMFGDASIEHFQKLVEWVSRHGWINTFTHDRTGDRYRWTLVHGLGPRFSLFVANALDEFMKKEYGVKAGIETSDALINITFQLPEK